MSQKLVVKFDFGGCLAIIIVFEKVTISLVLLLLHCCAEFQKRIWNVLFGFFQDIDKTAKRSVDEHSTGSARSDIPA